MYLAKEKIFVLRKFDTFLDFHIAFKEYISKLLYHNKSAIKNGEIKYKKVFVYFE